MAGRSEHSTRRHIDERARTRIAELEHRLELLAAALGVDLDELEHLDQIERRGGVPITWQEHVALGIDPRHEAV